MLSRHHNFKHASKFDEVELSGSSSVLRVQREDMVSSVHRREGAVAMVAQPSHVQRGRGGEKMDG